MKTPLFVVFPVLLIFTFSCNTDGIRTLPSSTGKSREIIVVMDSASWAGSQGSILRQVFQQEMAGLPQAEPLFKLIHVRPAGFTGILRLHRNVIVASAVSGSAWEEASEGISSGNNQWAKPQFAAYLKPGELRNNPEWLTAKCNTLLKRFEKEELDNMAAGYRKLSDRLIKRAISNRFGVSVIVPEGFYTAVDTPGFMWIRRETKDLGQGIIIYTIPDNAKSNLKPEEIISLRDSLTRLYVPGPSAGSFMAVEKQYPVQVSDIMPDGIPRQVLRGLWKTEHDFMGGPFVSYTFSDEKNNRFITLDGYVFAPRFDKRDYIRQLEAIFHTAELQ